MRIPHACPITLIMLFFVLFSFFSCSKDTDLLAEYVATDMHESRLISNIFIDDKYVINGNETIVLDVFSNDSISNPDKVSIIETSQPNYGTVIINENNSLTYSPNSASSEEDTVDNFSYTSETEQENGTTSTEETTVIVTKINDELEYWKQSFDTEWSRSLSLYKSQSSGPEVSGQRRYYDFRVVDGLIAILQATGDLKYVDDLVWYVDRVMSEAILSSDGYYDWPKGGTNFSLFDGHGWRNIHKFLYLAKTYPAIKNRLTSAKYDDYLAFWTTNLYDKWKSRGEAHFIRGLTHMSSHLSSGVSLWLYLIEDEPTKKAEYFSYVTAWNGDVDSKKVQWGKAGKGFRDQVTLRASPHAGYDWNNAWGSTGTSTDHTHANAEVQAVINQHMQGVEWTAADMTKFIATLNAMLDASPDSDYKNIPFRVSSNYNTSENTKNYLTYGWAMLGRFDATLQARLKSINPAQFKAAYYYNCFIGNMAYSHAYLNNNLVYPEF